MFFNETSSFWPGSTRRSIRIATFRAGEALDRRPQGVINPEDCARFGELLLKGGAGGPIHAVPRKSKAPRRQGIHGDEGGESKQCFACRYGERTHGSVLVSCPMCHCFTEAVPRCSRPIAILPRLEHHRQQPGRCRQPMAGGAPLRRRRRRGRLRPFRWRRRRGGAGNRRPPRRSRSS